MANIDHKDMNKGVYEKYTITRNDGRDKAGEKHHGCAYFALDLNHDPHARAAIKAYADSCRLTFPDLAKDLDELALRNDLFNPNEEPPHDSSRKVDFPKEA